MRSSTVTHPVVRSVVPILLMLLCGIVQAGQSIASADPPPVPLAQAKDESGLRVVRLTMQVIRVRFAADGTWEMTTVSTPMALGLFSSKTAISNDSRDANGDTVHHLGIEITPSRVEAETTDAKATREGEAGPRLIDLKGSFTIQERTDHFQAEQAIQGRVAVGKKLIIGLTDATDPQTRATIASGHLPTHVKSPLTAYYLHVTPTMVAGQ